jgi:hypothetical protein
MSQNFNNNRPRPRPRAPVFRPNTLNDKGEQISLFIPRVDVRTSFEKISFIFRHYYFGKVKSVDFILKQDKNGHDYRAAYVHFDHFYNSENCCILLDTIRKDGSDEIYCDKFDKNKKWIVSINTGKKRIAGQPKHRLNLDLLGVRVEVDESNSESISASSNIEGRYLKDYDKDYEYNKWAEDMWRITEKSEFFKINMDKEEGEI